MAITLNVHQNFNMHLPEMKEQASLAIVRRAEAAARPIPVFDEDEHGDYLIGFSYWKGPSSYSVFVTLENGTQYMIDTMWEQSLQGAESHIGSFLRAEKTVELIPVPSVGHDFYFYRNFSRFVFRDPETGATSPVFIKL